MSRARPYTYGTQAAAPPGYYYDDTEGYVGDYSESEGVSDTPHMVTATPDVTEIYRRKATAAQDHYQTVYVPPEYYYDAMTAQPLTCRTAVPGPYRKRVPVVNERPRYYTEGELYDPVTFRSSHQMAPHIQRNVPARAPSANALRQTAIRRHPITVRTPSYYRKAGGTTVYKRPSTLCLPVACQPDPAVVRRTKRLPNDQIYQQQEILYQTPSRTVTKPPSPIPQKLEMHKLQQANYAELNITRSKLDAALERYEQIFEKNSGAVETAGQLPSPKLVQILKPRVPSSIKEKQKQKKKNDEITEADIANANHLEVEDLGSDALEDILLADLTANGFNEKIKQRNKPAEDGIVKSPRSGNRSQSEKSPRSNDGSVKLLEKPVKDLPKSFNYQEIQKGVKTQQQQKPQPHQVKQVEVSETSTQSDIQPFQTEAIRPHSRPFSPCRQGCSQASPIISQRQQSTEIFEKTIEPEKSGRSNAGSRVIMDETIELHRTKSYVVNLIDQALSNHFGTTTCDKYPKECCPVTMDHRVAVDMIKKHSTAKVDKELCVEIAQVLADTFQSSSNCSSSMNTDSKQDTSSCSCSKLADEPIYVKQLKQLRWGHLKHIQREVRRLEDLERFLDSCSSNSFV